jgi:hypothetical protein
MSEKNWPEWLKGFVSGVLATIIGFALTVTWDIIKTHNESDKRDVAVLTAIKEDIAINLETLKYNKFLLQEDIKAIGEHKSIVQPMNQLQNGFWDIVKLNLPKKLISSPAIFLRVREAAGLTEYINEIIRSRESYRLNNGAMDNYYRHLKMYDDTLLTEVDKLYLQLEDLNKKL